MPAFSPLKFGLPVASLLLAAVSSAQTITTFTDRTAFVAALGSTALTEETFTSSPHFPITTGLLNSSTNLPGIGVGPGTIQPGVTYSVPVGAWSGYFFNIDAGAGYSGGFLDTVTNAGPLIVTFDSPVTAFGFDTNTSVGMGSAFNLTINFTAGPSYTSTVPLVSSTPSFFGFQSNGANIVSLSFESASTAGAFALDNFTFTPVPEPSTYALLGLGLLLLAARVRRRG